MLNNSYVYSASVDNVPYPESPLEDLYVTSRLLKKSGATGFEYGVVAVHGYLRLGLSDSCGNLTGLRAARRFAPVVPLSSNNDDQVGARFLRVDLI